MGDDLNEARKRLKVAAITAIFAEQSGPVTQVTGAAATAIYKHMLDEGVMPHADLISRESVLGRRVVVVAFNARKQMVTMVNSLRGTTEGGADRAAFVVDHDRVIKWARAAREDGDVVTANWLLRRTHFVGRVFLITELANFLLNYDADKREWSREPGSSDREYAALAGAKPS